MPKKIFPSIPIQPLSIPKTTRPWLFDEDFLLTKDDPVREIRDIIARDIRAMQDQHDQQLEEWLIAIFGSIEDAVTLGDYYEIETRTVVSHESKPDPDGLHRLYSRTEFRIIPKKEDQANA